MELSKVVVELYMELPKVMLHIVELSKVMLHIMELSKVVVYRAGHHGAFQGDVTELYTKEVVHL